MATEIKLWEIQSGKLIPSNVSLEEAKRKEATDLEKWIRSEPKILGEDIVIIGEQIQTKRGPLDFLGIDSSGNIVVIELKRDMLHREALVQAIDYASDVTSWDIEKLSEECSKYTGKSLEEYLTENFEEVEWEDISINHVQRILLVGTGVDESLERMVEWLSNNYDVSINVLVLKYTQTSNGDEVIARTSIIPEEIQQEKSSRHQKKIYAERHILRKEFWTGLLENSNKKTKLHAGISPGIYTWIGTGAGKSGISYNYVIHNKYAGIEIYLDRGKEYVNPNINKKRFDELIKHKEEIEEKFGDTLEWERLDDKRASKIAFRIQGIGLREREKWPELQEKMVDIMIKLENSFKDYIARLQ